MRFAAHLCLILFVGAFGASCKKTAPADEGAALRALVDRYAVANDTLRGQLFAELSALPCANDAVCTSKALCEKSMLSYRSATLSKGLAGGLVSTAHDDISRAAALAKLEEAATQFLDAKNGFEDCVRSASMLPRT